MQRGDTLITTGLAEWKKWTLTHGYMLEMGGFVLIDPEDENKGPDEQNRKVLTLDDLIRVLRDSEFEFPAITEADIRDQSKDDVLWIIITILQITWFIFQSIARDQRQYRLPPTQLELVTLALASMNVTSFLIWWKKPLGLQEPKKIYQKTDTRDIEHGFYFRPSPRPPIDGWIWRVDVMLFLERRFRTSLELRNLFITPIYIITFPFFVLFPLGIILLLKIIGGSVFPEPMWGYGLAARIISPLRRFHFSLRMTAVTNFVQRQFERILSNGRAHFLFGWFVLLPLLFVLVFLFTIILSPFITLLYLASFIFTATFGISTSWAVHPDASHVSFFYAPSTRSDRWSRVVVFIIFGAVIGGLHCFGWNFVYPNYTEQTLWRASSLAIAVIPLTVVAIEYLLITFTFKRFIFLALDLVRTTLLFVYIPVRLSLLGQAFALLRDLPPSAFVVADPTQYLPHLFAS